jgi:hypothetical protein
MSEKQPGSLAAADAVLDAQAAEGTPETARFEPAIGQIWMVRPDEGPDLCVLIVEVHGDHVRALLCGPDHHLATDTDSVLDPPTTGYLRSLLVHGDVSAAVLKHRLSHRVGRIEPHMAERIDRRGRGLDFNSNDLGRGSAIVSESDPRWSWKLDKHRQMRAVRARASELGWAIHKLGPRAG